jgi:hypothetical protein
MARSACRRLVGAVLAFISVALITADAAGAGGGQPPTLRVAKKPEGPYANAWQDVNLPPGEAKNFYFKVKNKTSSNIDTELSGTGDDLPDFKVRWFRGNNDITDDVVQPGAIDVTLDPGEVRRYRARVKHRDVQPDQATYCLVLFADGMFATRVAIVGIEAHCAVKP